MYYRQGLICNPEGVLLCRPTTGQAWLAERSSSACELAGRVARPNCNLLPYILAPQLDLEEQFRAPYYRLTHLPLLQKHRISLRGSNTLFHDQQCPTAKSHHTTLFFYAQILTLMLSLVGVLWQVSTSSAQLTTIPVREIKGPIPADGDNPVWEAAPTVLITLNPGAGPMTVRVRAITNGKEIAFWLRWGDSTLTNAVIGTHDYPDQAAVIFGSESDRKEIWAWDAAWQEGPGKRDIASVAPSFEEFPNGSNYPDRIGRSLGPFNMPTTGDEHIEKQTEKPRCPKASEQQFQCTPVPVGGHWSSTSSGGVWTVVFQRALITKNPSGIQFQRGKSVSMGIGMWDGAQAGSPKMSDVSCCYNLKLP